MIQKLIINSVIKLLSKQFKLDKVLEYVEKPNDADKKIKKMEKKLKKLEKEAIKWKIK
tara:strand:- start:27 stop:200 length:174 start_codon:yes stop_codon:yes gene_type:complete